MFLARMGGDVFRAACHGRSLMSRSGGLCTWAVTAAGTCSQLHARQTTGGPCFCRQAQGSTGVRRRRFIGPAKRAVTKSFWPVTPASLRAKRTVGKGCGNGRGKSAPSWQQGPRGRGGFLQLPVLYALGGGMLVPRCDLHIGLWPLKGWPRGADRSALGIKRETSGMRGKGGQGWMGELRVRVCVCVVRDVLAVQVVDASLVASFGNQWPGGI